MAKDLSRSKAAHQVQVPRYDLRQHFTHGLNSAQGNTGASPRLPTPDSALGHSGAAPEGSSGV
jgi:hypothetical protein